MPETIRHKRHERYGRTFEHLDELGQVIPNKYTVSTKIGQKNADAGDGTFAPYILNGAILKHGDSQCDFADGWQTIKHLGQAIISRSRLFIQRDVAGVWTDVPHGIPTRNVVHDYPKEGKCTAYLDFPDIQGYAQGARFQVGVEVGGNDRQTHGFRMRSPIAGSFRLEWVLDIPEDVDLEWITTKTSRTDPTPIRIGGRIGKAEIRWSVAEAPFRSATVESDGAGGRILHILLGPYTLAAQEWLTVYPDTIAPALGADADDGYESGGSWDVGGIWDQYNYVDSGVHSGWSFVFPGALAASATISKMYFRGYCNDGSIGTVGFKILVENSDPASAAIWSSTHLPHDGSWIRANADTDYSMQDEAWHFGESDNSPVNLASDLTDLLTSFGDIASGNRLNIAIIWQSDSYFALESYAWTGTNAAELLITYTAGGPTIEQEGFRFRNDDGSKSAATWKANQDTNITLAADTAFRLRFLLKATGNPDSIDAQVEVRVKPSGGAFGAWTKVN